MTEITPESKSQPVNGPEDMPLSYVERIHQAIDIGRSSVRFFIRDIFPRTPSKKELAKREEERRWRMSGGHSFLTAEELEEKRHEVIRGRGR